MKNTRIFIFTILILTVKQVLSLEDSEEEYWNVLSFDGGGIRGLIPSTIVDYMEKYSYNYSREAYCLPERKDTLKVSMAELFDMISGTSTGSLLATALVLPNNDTSRDRVNQYFAEDAIRIYTEYSPIVFTKYVLNWKYHLLGTLLFALLGGLIGLWVGHDQFTSRNHEGSMRAFKQYIEIRRNKIEDPLFQSNQSTDRGSFVQGSVASYGGPSWGGGLPTDYYQSNSESIMLISTLAMNLQTKLIEIDHGLELKRRIDHGNLDDLDEVEEELDQQDRKYHEKRGIKWIYALIGFVLWGIVGYFLVPGMYQVSKPNYDRRGFDRISEQIVGRVQLLDALTPEVLIVAFEYTKHEPRLFSKYSARKQPEIFNVTIINASQASSAAPVYFNPKVIGDQILLDGGLIANNPSLFSYLHSKYANEQKKIRLISLGTGAIYPDVLDPRMSNVEWFMEVGNLIANVEQFTQEYLMKMLLKEEYYRYQPIIKEDLALDSYRPEDISRLIQYGEEIIEKQGKELRSALRKIIDQKFGKTGKYSC
eukprot:403358603